MAKEKSNANKIKRLERQYFRNEGDKATQDKIQGRINSLKNQK